MAKRRPKGEDQAAQHLRFIEAAHALGCDEDEVAFDEKLKVLAKQHPKVMDVPAPDGKRRKK
jgi:hypothetical protein